MDGANLGVDVGTIPGFRLLDYISICSVCGVVGKKSTVKYVDNGANRSFHGSTLLEKYTY